VLFVFYFHLIMLRSRAPAFSIRVRLSFAPQIRATPRTGFHLPNKFAGKFSGTNVAQHRSHVLLHCLIDNFWTDSNVLV
jgi:hypothetical protein